MNEIVPGLYLGSFQDAQKLSVLQERGITHILTLNTHCIPKRISNHFEYLFIEIDDVEDADIISEFPRIVAFISAALQQNDGAILVHCMMGISRSSTAVIAYLLSFVSTSAASSSSLPSPLSDLISSSSASSCSEIITQFVKSRRPIICPNDAFANQLRLWEQMGTKLDPLNKTYKQHKLFFRARRTQLGRNEKKEEQLNTDFAQLPSRSAAAHSEREGCVTVWFKCYKCRKDLFTNENLLVHYLPSESALMRQFPRLMASSHYSGGDDDNNNKNAENDVENERDGESELFCRRGELFIEPMDWMKHQILRNSAAQQRENKNDVNDANDEDYKMEGRINCPRCAIKIGSFNWFGEKCVCGKWMIPAFHINKNHVDKCDPAAMQTFVEAQPMRDEYHDDEK